MLPNNIEVSVHTDVGKVRANNEDSVYINIESKILIIADGMGGHNGGEIASKLAVEIVSKYLTDRIENNILKEIEIDNYLVQALNLANSKIRIEGSHNPSLYNMGTTLVLCVISETNNLHIANVGDSRLYIIDIQREKISKLTIDHTLAENQYRDGKISKEYADKHPLRHILAQALGISEQINPYLTNCKWHQGEYLLLCSDGLTDMIYENDILDIFKKNYKKKSDEICKTLVEIANNNGGRDNVTVIVSRRNA
ncbi:MAG: Stp1/IreP family PP2C-type Ser/Thr phosphatase [Nitrososphaeraceae archaeon]